MPVEVNPEETSRAIAYELWMQEVLGKSAERNIRIEEAVMKELAVYIHGKGGSAGESEHIKPLFPECEVVGLDYRTFTPWETGKEIREAVTKLKAEYDSIVLIANSIGAFFSMNAGIDAMIRRAYFISSVVDMEQLILNMMSWEYLCYVREHPVSWAVPTRILYGSRDNLTPYETISAFAKAHNAELTVWKMESIGSIRMNRCGFWIIGS